MLLCLFAHRQANIIQPSATIIAAASFFMIQIYSAIFHSPFCRISIRLYNFLFPLSNTYIFLKQVITIKVLYLIIILTITMCIFFFPFFSSNYSENSNSGNIIFIDTSSEYIWPIPGYTKVSSYFGKRTAPTQGAATYHTGIDLPAPEGTSLFAVCDGEITFTGFLGGGGYTITLEVKAENIKFTYCHVSPNYVVSVGDKIEKGDLIRTRWSKICLWSFGQSVF